MDNIDDLKLYQGQDYFHANGPATIAPERSISNSNSLATPQPPRQPSFHYVSNRHQFISQQSIQDYWSTPTPSAQHHHSQYPGTQPQPHYSQHEHEYPTPPTVHKDIGQMERDSLGVPVTPLQYTPKCHNTHIL